MEENQEMKYVMEKITDVDKLPTFEEVKNLYNHLKTQTSSSGLSSGWHEFCLENGLENIYTVEFVDALAEKIEKLKKGFFSGGSPVLEINAGNGKLAYHLGEKGIMTQATAEFPKGETPNDLVETMLVGKALEEYQPEIVIASPIPYGSCGIEVLTFPSVKYLIEIGVQKRDGETWRTEEEKRLENIAHHIESLDVKTCVKDDPDDLENKGPIELASIDLFVIGKE